MYLLKIWYNTRKSLLLEEKVPPQAVDEVYMNINNPKLTPRAQKLRRDMTKEERHLWYDFLKNLPVTIHRQKVIGNYIVDFYCASAQIAIELDGSQHFTPDGKEYDRQRDAYLQSRGIIVLRYSNGDIHRNFEGVCTDIHRNIFFRLADSITDTETEANK